MLFLVAMVTSSLGSAGRKNNGEIEAKRHFS